LTTEEQARLIFHLEFIQNEVIPFFDESIKREELFAKSDITYDVTFEHVKDAFIEAGVEFTELKTQMVALVNMGILELLEILKEKAGEKIYKQELEKAKILIMPNFLGERFKMIRFRKN
jgi:SAM-dependent MidA family methyltransferase